MFEITELTVELRVIKNLVIRHPQPLEAYNQMGSEL